MLGPTRIAERYARALAAAVAAVACLLLAANAGPTDTAGSPTPAPAHDTAPVMDDLSAADRDDVSAADR